MIYLDNAATTQIDPAVLLKLKEVESDFYANPSSVHSAGQKSRYLIEKSRDIIADTIGCASKEITFTSGGTESNNLALIGTAIANREKGNHIISTRVEHPSVLNTLKYLSSIGFSISYLEVDENGFIDLNTIQKLLSDDTILISVMMVNNEIGNIFSVNKIGQLLKDSGIIFHVDAIQAFGKIDINTKELNADLISFSAHKIYGPKGVGALYIRSGTRIDNIFYGGSQERIMRAGTENLSGIAGFGEAAEQLLIHKNEKDQIKNLRDSFENKLLSMVPEIEVHCKKSERVFNISNIFFPNISIDSFILNLDLEGIACSAGSACSSGSLTNSHVLAAMKLPKEHLNQSIRFSFGRFNTITEIDQTIKIITDIYNRLKKE